MRKVKFTSNGLAMQSALRDSETGELIDGVVAVRMDCDVRNGPYTKFEVEFITPHGVAIDNLILISQTEYETRLKQEFEEGKTAGLAQE